MVFSSPLRGRPPESTQVQWGQPGVMAEAAVSELGGGGRRIETNHKK